MLWISIKNDRQSKHFEHPGGPIEFGRGPQGELPRFVIEDGFVSRDHLRVEELAGGKARFKNLSTKNPVMLEDGTFIPATQHRDLDLPVRITLGQTVIAVTTRRDEPVPTQRPNPHASMGTMTVDKPGTTLIPAGDPEPAAPQEAIADDGYLSIQPVHQYPLDDVPSLGSLGDAPPPEMLTQWMETVLALQRSDAGPAELYARTARALVNMIGLDIGLVLLHGDRGWQVVARHAAEAMDSRRLTLSGREFSQTVLRHVLAQKQTFYQDLGRMKSQESLKSVDAVVVSPIFGLNQMVVGAVYGVRRTRERQKSCKVGRLEAQLVQLLAAAVGANLARTLAIRTRTQFEQFFSPELVRELERDPGLLEGRAHEVTILVCDLRDFSTLAERVGPQQTCRLIRDVMERLSERVVENNGVIVSYLGDGMLAMWNAPARQEDHAARACRAALAMLGEMPALNAEWQSVVGHPLRLGIGINTGPAQVGNTGSSRKFMYGPLGGTVNLASRVEGATKHLKVPMLLTGSTRAYLGDAFITRRLCQVRVVGIQGTVDLYELHETATPEWLAYRDTYETALALYESRQWLKTCQTLLPLLEQGQGNGEYDHATLKLMKRSWACLETPPEPFDPVLELSSK